TRAGSRPRAGSGPGLTRARKSRHIADAGVHAGLPVSRVIDTGRPCRLVAKLPTRATKEYGPETYTSLPDRARRAGRGRGRLRGGGNRAGPEFDCLGSGAPRSPGYATLALRSR